MDSESSSKSPEQPSSRQGRAWLQSTGRATVKKSDSIHVVSVAIPDANAAPGTAPTPVVETIATGGASSVDRPGESVVYHRADSDPSASQPGSSQLGAERPTAQRLQRARSASYRRGQATQSIDVDSLDDLLSRRLQGESIGGIPDAAEGEQPDMEPIAGEPVHSEHEAAVKSIDEPQSDLDEETDDWLPRKEQEPRRRSTDSDHLFNRLQPSAALEGLARRLDELAKKRPGCIVLLCGCHDGDRSADAAALTAITTAHCSTKSLCLIDGDLNTRSLSRIGGDDQELGVANVMATQTRFDDVVWATSRDRLDWIPAGNVRRSGWYRFDENLNQLLTDCQERYDLICVYLPTGVDELAKLWAGHVDASYLIVSMQRTSQVVAEAAVENLRRQGARLAGCIVTDAPVDLVPASAN